MYETAQEENLNEWQILNDGNVCFSNGDRLHPKVFAKNAFFIFFISKNLKYPNDLMQICDGQFISPS